MLYVVYMYTKNILVYMYTNLEGSMKIDRDKFFDNYIHAFGSIKKPNTVDNINTILNIYLNMLPAILPLEKLAYILATVRHECGPNMLPITENLNYSAARLMKVWPSRFQTKEIASKYANDPISLGNKVYGGRLGNGVFEGYKYRGRGFVQITGFDNYKKFSYKLNVDLVGNPDLANDIIIGTKILIIGMFEGLFTGKKLSGAINSTNVDFVNARDIVNSDKNRVGQSIANDAKLFLHVLEKSVIN